MTSPALITPSHRHEKGSLVKKLNKEIEERKNGSVDIDRRLVLLEQESNLHTLSARQIGVNVECALVKYIWAESQRKPFFLSKLAEVFEFLEDSSANEPITTSDAQGSVDVSVANNPD
jgi:hypothetical protein